MGEFVWHLRGLFHYVTMVYGMKEVHASVVVSCMFWRNNLSTTPNVINNAECVIVMMVSWLVYVSFLCSRYQVREMTYPNMCDILAQSLSNHSMTILL